MINMKGNKINNNIQIISDLKSWGYASQNR